MEDKIERTKKKITKDYEKVCKFLEDHQYHENNPLDIRELPDRYGGWYESDTKNIVVNVIYYHELSNAIPLFTHEKAHAICDNFGLNKKGPNNHFLEFALLYYVMDLNINPKHDKHYFRSYDVQDDICYEKFTINLKRFDDRVKSFKFKTIKDLMIQIIEYSDDYREKLGYERQREEILKTIKEK